MVDRKSLYQALMATTVSAVLFTIGCTGKPSTRTVHEDKAAEFNERPISKSEARNQIVSTYNSRFQISAQISSANDAQSALAIAQNLEPSILNLNVLSDPEQSGVSQFGTILGLFHRAIDKAYTLDKKVVIASGILDRYQRIVLDHCTMENQGCIRLKHFRKDHLTGRILMLAAEGLEEKLTQLRSDSTQQPAYHNTAFRYYRLLQLAYEMGNNALNPQLDQKYVTFARDYYAYFRSLPESDQKPELHRIHRETLSLALDHLRNQSQSGNPGQSYCDFLIALNPLESDMFNELELDKRAQTAMTGEFVKCASDRKVFSDLIGKHISAHKGEGFDIIRKDLNENPSIYKNLAADVPERSDLAFFVLDQVYYQKINANIAMSYWEKVGKINDRDFIRFVRKYARAQAAFLTRKTLDIYNKALADRFIKRGGLGSDFFEDVVKDVNSSMQFEWDELKERQYAIRELLIRLYDGQLGQLVKPELKDTQTDYLNLKTELSNLPYDFSLAITSPMAIPLYYYMAKAQGSIKFLMNWWDSSDQYFDIPAAQALGNYFEPSDRIRGSLFKFGELYYQHDNLQKLHMLDFALRIGIFDQIDFGLLDEDKAFQLPSEALFFKQISKDRLSIIEKTLRTKIDNLEQLSNSPNFKDRFMGMCLDPLNASTSMNLTELKMGTMSENNMFDQVLTTVYDQSIVPAWRFERQRLEQMLAVFKNYLYSDGAEHRLTSTKLNQRDLIVRELESQIENIQKLEREMWSKTMDLDHKIVSANADCLDRITRADYFRRTIVMEMNVDYFKNVHAAMTILRLVGDESSDILEAQRLITRHIRDLDVKARAQKLLSTINTLGIVGTAGSLKSALNDALNIHNVNTPAYQKIGYPVGEYPTLISDSAPNASGRIKTLNSFDGQTFNQGLWDSLIRVRQMLNVGQVNGAEASQYIGIPNNGPTLIGRNVDIPLGSIGTLELDSIYKDFSRKQVPYADDQREFVRRAMTQFGGAEPNGTQYVSWYSTGGLSIRLLQRRLNWLNDVKGYGALELLDTDPVTCGKDIWGHVVPTRDLGNRMLVSKNVRTGNCNSLRVSARDMADQYLKIIALLKITDADRDLLDLMDRPGKLENIIESFLRYNGEISTSKWSYFDQFYRRYFTSYRVTTQDAKGLPSEQWIEKLSGADQFIALRDSDLKRVGRVALLLPSNPYVTQIARNSEREKILNNVTGVIEFEEEVAKLEDQKINLGPMYISTTSTPAVGETVESDRWRPDQRKWRIMDVKSRPSSSSRAGTPIYLRDVDSAKTWWAGYVEGFIAKSTNCTVLARPGDPDYDSTINNASASCALRIKEWQQQNSFWRQQIRKVVRGG